MRDPGRHSVKHDAEKELTPRVLAVKTKDGAVIVYNVAFSLEWVLTSPPPLHAFLEPPIIVEW